MEPQGPGSHEPPRRILKPVKPTVQPKPAHLSLSSPKEPIPPTLAEAEQSQETKELQGESTEPLEPITPTQPIEVLIPEEKPSSGAKAKDNAEGKGELEGEAEEELDPANLPVSHLRLRFEEQLQLKSKADQLKEAAGTKTVVKKKEPLGALKDRVAAFEDRTKEAPVPLTVNKPRIKVRKYFDAKEYGEVTSQTEGNSTPTSRAVSTSEPLDQDDEPLSNEKGLDDDPSKPPHAESIPPESQESNEVTLRADSSSSSSSEEEEEEFFESVEELKPALIQVEGDEIDLSAETPPLVDEIGPESVTSNVERDPSTDLADLVEIHSEFSEKIRSSEPSELSMPSEPSESFETSEPSESSEQPEPSEQTEQTDSIKQPEPSKPPGDQQPSAELSPKKRESQDMEDSGTDAHVSEDHKKRRLPGALQSQPRWDTTMSVSLDPSKIFFAPSSPPKVSDQPPSENLTSSRLSTFNYSDFSIRYQLEKKATNQPDEWILLESDDLPPAPSSRPRVTTQHHRSATMISDDISFAGKVGLAVASQLSQQERQRQEAIFELIFSEQCFRDDMKRVIEVFLNPLKRENILTPKEINKMFLNLPDLYDFSVTFSAALLKRQDEDNFVVKKIGDVLLQHVGTMIIFGPYTRNYSSVVQDLQDRQEWHEEFVEFVVKGHKEASPPMEMDLKGNLIKPLQRLTKMPLLIAAILKNTPPDHEDYEGLVAASELIQQVVTEVNSCT